METFINRNPGLLPVIIISVLGITALLPQMIALAVTAPDFLRTNTSLLVLLSMWFQVDPGQVTGGDSAVHLLISWGLLLVFAAATVVAAVLYVKHLKNPQNRAGLAKISDVVKELGTTQLVKKRAPRMRPSIPKSELKPHHAGFKVGTFHSESCWIRFEDPTIVIGPSRSGKGWYLVLNWILAAPGALITTSSKMDNAMMTMRAREKAGSKTWIFAPGIAGGQDIGRSVRWDPVVGCEEEETLIRRIKALIPANTFGSGTTNGGHWDTLGQQLAAHLFHAAALAGYGVDKIWEWVGSPVKAMDAVRIIRDYGGLKEHATHLETVLMMPGEQRSSQWAVLPTSLAFLESDSARAWMRPGSSDEAFDVLGFFANCETLYLVGDKQTTGGYTRIIDGLLAELDYVSKGLADATEAGRLDPPVSYLLDEAGNFEYQGLYELITAGGGRGRVGVAVFQSKTQLAQFGENNEEVLWDAAVAKIILPGGANERELQALSTLIGHQWLERASRSISFGQKDSIQISRDRQSILEPSEIRELKSEYGLLFYRNLKPVIVKLSPFSAHPWFSQCETDAKELADLIRQKSKFAGVGAAKGLTHAR